ncbi:MAG TPA: acetyl-CoA carboxylase biotin carboxyl carrier protein [Candidatus Lachnoclostridium stercoripullorum]|uniref:Biotin carboxyl carrier protein of acetyl-CoA carboxylase n=1 Tax=Candidatus Lachnoclostridium stercoripullorum TaxID=2838635 RepID=A0A9D2AX20_9FIRM|nr:acetyl-CoA carboxylase biotin carboxyl carrier protein [Candidatus Lachnoclostridium stercoripullorum]
MEIKEIIQLIEAVSENALTSFELEQGNTKISIKKKGPKVVQVAGAAGSVTGPAEEVVTVLDAQVQPAAEPKKAAADIGSDKVVTSPLVGTFYSASSPDAEPFVKEGDTVKKGQVLGIIEAMKLMNEIESEYDGVVEAVLVGNEEVVEYGQPLFRIR